MCMQLHIVRDVWVLFLIMSFKDEKSNYIHEVKIFFYYGIYYQQALSYMSYCLDATENDLNFKSCPWSHIKWLEST